MGIIDRVIGRQGWNHKTGRFRCFPLEILQNEDCMIWHISMTKSRSFMKKL